MSTLTIFSPSFNRVHTLVRTYESLCKQSCNDFEWLIIDDGSRDGTRKWVESLGEKARLTGPIFDWMGRRMAGENEDYFVINLPKFKLTYIRKPNGGLYTGYNVAYSTIETELCVCIDSDDFMPDDAVQKIVGLWREHYPKGSELHPKSVITGKEYCGIIGLDFYFDKGTPIGGYFPDNLKETYRADLFINNIHCGDSKEVMRTALMKKVSPQVGFKGERNFNPSYMLSQVWDKYPLLVLNENLCVVEYQIVDSMSKGIYRQYIDSPRSFAKLRILHMQLLRYPYSLKFRAAAHYVSSCLITRDKNCFKKTPLKLTTLLATPMGIIIYALIKLKTWSAK